MKQKIKVGVIPAAGAGRRLGYLSGLLPKTLFPVYDRPIIHFVIDQMQSVGVEDIYIVVNIFQDRVRSYLDLIKMDLRARIHIIEQSQLGGTGDAINTVQKLINEPFMVIYGDDCTITSSLEDMVDNFYKKDPIVLEAVIKEKDKKILRQTCSVKLKPSGKILEIIEKPENPPYFIRGCGVYIFSPEIFNYIKATPVHPIRKEIEITYTINMLAKMGKAYGFPIKGYNININDYDQLLKASNLIKMLKSEANNLDIEDPSLVL
jgi:dTDP-glucose pyrophosphorylase